MLSLGRREPIARSRLCVGGNGPSQSEAFQFLALRLQHLLRAPDRFIGCLNAPRPFKVAEASLGGGPSSLNSCKTLQSDSKTIIDRRQGCSHRINVSLCRANAELVLRQAMQERRVRKLGIIQSLVGNRIHVIEKIYAQPFGKGRALGVNLFLCEIRRSWASPSFPDTSNDMMCSGDRNDKNPKELHGRVQT